MNGRVHTDLCTWDVAHANGDLSVNGDRVPLENWDYPLPVQQGQYAYNVTRSDPFTGFKYRILTEGRKGRGIVSMEDLSPVTSY